MFEIGWSELMLIGIVALIVIGPKELPGVLRTVGRTVTKLRRMAGEFQGQFQEALREADLADMRKEISDITESTRSTLATSDMFDPLKSIRDEIRQTVEGTTAQPAADIPAPDLPPAPEPAVVVSDPLDSVRDEIRRTMTAAVPTSAVPPDSVPVQEPKSAS